MFLLGALIGSVGIYEYLRLQHISSVLLAILAVVCVMGGLLFASVGLTLHTLNFRILEMTNVLTKQINRSRKEVTTYSAQDNTSLYSSDRRPTNS